jgi:hypothetical protein
MPVLLQEERVSSGLVPEHGGRRPGRCPGHAGLAEQVLRYILGREADQVDPLDPVQSVQFRKCVGDRVRAVRSCGATRGHQQQLLSGRGLGHMGEQCQGRLLRPMQVLEDQHERPAIGHRQQHAQHRIEEDRPRLEVAGGGCRGSRPVAGRAGGQP